MPGYRDDHEAALRRAEALERELAEAKEDLADKDRALADKDRALADKDRALAETARETAARHAATADADAARARLDALRRAPAEAPPSRPSPRPPPPAVDGGWALRRRVLASMMWHGDLIVSGMALILFLPMAGLSFYATAILTGRHASGWVVAAGTFGPWLILIGLPWLYLPFHYWSLMRWSRTRGYALVGYPEVLASELTRDGGATVRVRVELADPASVELAAIVRGFDTAVTVGPGGVLSRPCPTTDLRRHGKRAINAESCWPLHVWLRRLERTVLRPLHAAHGLVRVTVTRTTDGR